MLLLSTHNGMYHEMEAELLSTGRPDVAFAMNSVRRHLGAL